VNLDLVDLDYLANFWRSGAENGESGVAKSLPNRPLLGLKREDVQPVVDKLLKRKAGCRGKLLSFAAKMVLIKSYLASIPVYLLSFVKFLNWAIMLEHISNT
jgi:hypothetical protein